MIVFYYSLVVCVIKQQKSAKLTHASMRMSTVSDRIGVENPLAMSLPVEIENESKYDITENF